MSGSSSASDPLPMPDTKQRSPKYVVKSSKILWNSHTRNLNTFYHILLILPLILTCHVVSNEMKRTSSNSLRSAWWTWHISNPLCVVFLSLISPFHLRLALSGSILSCLSAHDRFLSMLTLLTKHQAWAPSGPMLLLPKFRFVRVELRFNPSANAWQQTKMCKVRGQIISDSLKFTCKKSQHVLPHSSHTSSDTHISCGLQWNEKNKLNFTQICMTDLDGLSTIFCVVFLSVALSIAYLSLSSSSTPSSPNTKPEPLQGQCCWIPNSGLPGWSCASVRLPKPDRRQRCAKYVVKSSQIPWNSHTRNLNTFYHILLILPLILTYHVVSNEMKRTSSNSLRSAWRIWMDLAHLGINLLCSLPFTHFTISPSIGSVLIPHYSSFALLTGSSESSPSSPNTKPEPRYHQCCCPSNSGLSGSSCASVLLPMPDSRQRSADYVVKSSKMLSNSHARNF